MRKPVLFRSHPKAVWRSVLRMAGMCWCMLSLGWAQSTVRLRLLDSTEAGIVNFTTDNLGNLFLVNNRQQVKKRNSHLDSVAVYNDVRRYGELAAIDASNPLKILLFYQDFLTIVVLDRLLDVRNTIDLRQSNILQCSAIANAYDNQIWLFDELDSKVKKIDDAGKLLLESADFRIWFDDPLHPRQLEDFNKYLYAYDSSRGLLLMDYYGAYKKLMPLKELKNIQAFNNGIIATGPAGLVYLEPAWLEPQLQTLPPEMVRSQKLRFFTNRLFALRNGRVYVYEMTS